MLAVIIFVVFFLPACNNRMSTIDDEGEETLTNLEELMLPENQISDIKGLETLANLKRLNLEGNQISEIKCLENLTNLEMLNLNRNQITELKGLQTLTNLKTIWMQQNNIQKLMDLNFILPLDTIYLSDNQISYINWDSLDSKIDKNEIERRTYLDGNPIGEPSPLENILNQGIKLNSVGNFEQAIDYFLKIIKGFVYAGNAWA